MSRGNQQGMSPAIQEKMGRRQLQRWCQMISMLLRPWEKNDLALLAAPFTVKKELTPFTHSVWAEKGPVN